jgi:hypothetical protein
MTGKRPRSRRASARGAALAHRVLPAFVTALAALATSACGNKLPAIEAVEWRLESRPAPVGPPYESLSVFASVKDDDGIDDILEIWVLKDDSAYAWKFTDTDWIKATDGGDDWIGASAIATPELASMPRGTYRFVAIDAAGQRAEKDFEVTGGFPDRKAPSLSCAGGILTIDSTWPETLALAFDAAGTLLASPGAPEGPSSLAGAFGSDLAARTVQVGAYGYDPALKMGAFSDRVKAR